MTLSQRLDKVEQELLPRPVRQSPVAMVMEDESGQWWQHGEKVDPETIATSNPKLLRIYRLIRTSGGSRSPHN